LLSLAGISDTAEMKVVTSFTVLPSLTATSTKRLTTSLSPFNVFNASTRSRSAVTAAFSGRVHL